jgi:hypothetical protein
VTSLTSSPSPRRRVEPLDPNSAKGREVAERLGNILAELEIELAEQELAKQDVGRAA